MGHSYGARGMVCDFCGNDHPTTKTRSCKHGYCPGADACADCWNNAGAKAKLHKHCDSAGCKARSEAFAATEARRRELLATGAYVRCSALGKTTEAGDCVHVLFRNAAGHTIGFFMTHEAYDALPLLNPYTPDDYRKHGELIPAPSDFYAAA